MAEVPLRYVTIRPSHAVPAIADSTLRDVFGATTRDPRVEFMVLSFEYWLRGGATRRLLLQKMLDVLPPNLDEGNAYRFVALLAKRGVADDFFDLMVPSIDRNGALRALLMAAGVTIDTIAYHASWNGIDPREFFSGFVAGVAESAASTLIDMVSLIKLIARVYETEMRTLLLLVTDPREGMDSLRGQVALIGSVFSALIEQLDPARLPAAIVAQWREWNQNFMRHLEQLDPFAAGRLLGNIAGTLWQMITGLVGIVKLLQLSGRAALAYASLLLGNARRPAREAAFVIADLARILVALGRQLVEALPTIGLAAFRTLFPPRFLRQLVKEGRALLSYGDLTVMPVFQECFAMAHGGAQMRAPLGMIVAHRGKPVAMGVLSERPPPPYVSPAAGRSIDATLDQLNDLIKESDPPGKASLEHIVAAAVALQLCELRISTQLQKVVAKVTYDAFNELRRSGRRFFGNDLGLLVHSRMALRLEQVIGAAAPGLGVFTEKSVRTIYRALAADKQLAKTLPAAGAKALEERLVSFVGRQPVLMSIIGIPEDAAARTPEAVGQVLKQRFQWGEETAVGDLVCDLALVDADAKRLINVDWTSSTRAELHEQTWRKISRDLGSGFSGDPDQVADAYRHAFKGDYPAGIKADLQRLTNHAVRETVVRKYVFEQLLGNQWPVSSHEVLYDGLGKLWAPKKTPAVSP